MKRLKVTSVLADESMENENSMGESREGEWTKTDIIRFLCDSVTILYTNGVTGESDRAVRVEKMRRTNHKREYIGMRLTDNGIEVLAKNQIQETNQINQAMQPQQSFQS